MGNVNFFLGDKTRRKTLKKATQRKRKYTAADKAKYYQRKADYFSQR